MSSLALVDFYPNAEAWKAAAETTLADVIDAIRDGEFAEPVAAIRAAVAAGEMATAGELKKQLSAVSLSGVVTSGGRKAAASSGRFKHSGLLQIDLDAKDNPGWSVAEMVAVIATDPHTAAVFVGPSGTGVKGVARISNDPTNHLACFLAAEAHFLSLGLKIDTACKDPVRLCFVSHDPSACLVAGTAEFQPALIAPAGVLEPLNNQHVHHDSAAPRHFTTPSGGLLLRANDSGRELTASTVAEMLATIPPRPEYSEWLRIASAVWDALGQEAGTSALLAWSPEEKEGEYHRKFSKRLTDIHAGTLVMLAKENGYSPRLISAVNPSTYSPKPAALPTELTVAQLATLTGVDKKNIIPAEIFPVPAGDISVTLAASHIFSIIGPTKTLFMRSQTMHEVAVDEDNEFSLIPATAARLVSVIENFGTRIMRRENREGGGTRWRSVIFPEASARFISLTNEARTMLPRIRQIVAAPILIPDPSSPAGCTLLDHGWHAHGRGTFITSAVKIPTISLEKAIELIQSLVADFDFTSAGDASRAIASFISPALKIGGWLDEDFPLDIAEADQSQSGKTYRQKLICAIYKETPSAITQPVGGVGSLDERVSTALITGRPFISFDNFRGRLDSQILETAIRGLGKVSCRALRIAVDVDTTPFLWQLSTNGAELTRDLANRSVITRIRKRADGHAFTRYPEGDILAHVKSHQPRFLAAVHAIIREWSRLGCQATDESRHDFRAWTRTLDWIVQNIFEMPPLMDGHREEQLRTANPKLQWLRDIIHAIVSDGHGGNDLTAADLAEASEEHDIPLPGRRSNSLDAIDLAVGKLLSRLFKEQNGADHVAVDGRVFRRHFVHEKDLYGNHKERKIYTIS